MRFLLLLPKFLRQAFVIKTFDFWKNIIVDAKKNKIIYGVSKKLKIQIFYNNKVLLFYYIF